MNRLQYRCCVRAVFPLSLGIRRRWRVAVPSKMLHCTRTCSFSFAGLVQAWRHLSRSLAPARDKEAKSGDGARAKDANRMIGVALQRSGCGPWADRGKASVRPAVGAKPRCRIHGPKAGCNGMLAILRRSHRRAKGFRRSDSCGLCPRRRRGCREEVKKAFVVSAAGVSDFFSGTVYSHRQYRGYLLPRLLPHLKAEGQFIDTIVPLNRAMTLQRSSLHFSAVTVA